MRRDTWRSASRISASISPARLNSGRVLPMPCAAVTTLCLVLAAAYAAVLVVPFARDFFALAPPSLPILLIAAGGCFVAIGGLVMTSDLFIPGRGTS